MDSDLSGKVVLITGAAKGIGRATALAFNEGADLALLDIDKAELDIVRDEAEKVGVKVSTAVTDLGSGKGVSQGVTDGLAPFGGTIDVLVNNVGTGAVRTFDQLKDDDWNATFNINFLSYVRTCRAVLPLMRAKGGSIVNNASDLARQPEPVPIDYSASKAAVLALTRSGAIGSAEDPRECGRAGAGMDSILDQTRWLRGDNGPVSRCLRNRRSNTRCL